MRDSLLRVVVEVCFENWPFSSDFGMQLTAKGSVVQMGFWVSDFSVGFRMGRSLPHARARGKRHSIRLELHDTLVANLETDGDDHLGIDVTSSTIGDID